MALIQTIEADKAKGRTLAAFVMKAIMAPDAVNKADVDKLHDLGWADADIVDAVAHGINMVGSGILMKTFKMEQAC
jgi:alkylhydroperoxidase family enzyme